eukprot:CAMPEP_0206257860 /NCGR_PEP_ID=MMETSP0047_2-20121206/25586_1 /ASSEMBLY_ACC=CAM_ASM_000192 /TAXON_ID=195065 /ORGANISM="Chroomonas mesostigmatica_cf, Strain CCMP1168" /LENGTH=130 /DNA_ID=CAMNT_0053684515 /DNA_START=766 /DNA_END=1154 /DNA_ORIENTATION=+
MERCLEHPRVLADGGSASVETLLSPTRDDVVTRQGEAPPRHVESLHVRERVVHVYVCVGDDNDLVGQEALRVQESVVVLQPITLHVLHELVTLLKVIQIHRLLRQDVHVADVAAGHVLAEALINLSLPHG